MRNAAASVSKQINDYLHILQAMDNTLFKQAITAETEERTIHVCSEVLSEVIPKAIAK